MAVQLKGSQLKVIFELSVLPKGIKISTFDEKLNLIATITKIDIKLLFNIIKNNLTVPKTIIDILLKHGFKIPDISKKPVIVASTNNSVKANLTLKRY